MINPFLETAKEIHKTAAALYALKKVDENMRRAERRLARRMNNLLGNVTSGVLAELERMGHVPSTSMERRQIQRIFQELGSSTMQLIMDEEITTIAELGRNQTISQLQRAGESISFSDFDERTLARITEHAFEASARTMERLSGQVMEHLGNAYEQGLGIGDAMDLIRGDFSDMAEHELERVARTEIHSAQEEGKFLTEQELGVEFHQWIAATDDRTREQVNGNEAHGHDAMNGQIVRVGDKFSNGLEYAGDRAGGESTIGHWVNCRCRTVPFLMPEGKRPPMGKTYFYENDLVDAV